MTMNTLTDKIIKAANKRGLSKVKVNIGKKNASLSVNGLVRFSGHSTMTGNPNLSSLLQSIEEHGDLSWMQR